MKKGPDTHLNSPLRPSRYVEHHMITSLLNGTYAQGSVLPNERMLAEKIGVTRQTLRETLHRLATEGWITIRHGKPTVVNNYWEKGGMGLLNTVSRYSDYLPDGFIIHLLEVRTNLLPAIARQSAEKSPGVLLKYLLGAEALEDKAETFYRYDWDLQLLMAHHANNPVYRLMYNDFSSMFESLALQYFRLNKARKISRAYYLDLYHAVKLGKGDVEGIVRTNMEKSIQIWKELKGLSL